MSLFTGAGGLDIGLEEAGFRVVLCVERDMAARDTIQLNRPRWTLAEPGDIHLLAPRAALEQTGLQRGEVTLLSGGPPCQPFSKSGYWAHGDSPRLSDPRASTLHAYLEWADAFLPETILLENVSGLVFRGKDEGLRLLFCGIEGINRRNGVAYRPCVIRINAVSFGVPQARERVILVAHRDGYEFELPPPTHLSPDQAAEVPGAQPHRTAWDAIGDLA